MNRRGTARGSSPIATPARGTYELVASAATPPKPADAIGAQTTTVKHQTSTITTPARSSGTTIVDLGARRLVVACTVFFAPGHVGLTGVAISNAGIQLVPWQQPGQYVYGDSERLEFPMGLFLVGPITVATINADTYPHTVQLTWKLDDQAAPV